MNKNQIFTAEITGITSQGLALPILKTVRYS